MGRTPKKPARSEDMPRTEVDLDVVMTAIENHKAESNRIGELVLEDKITPEEIIDQSSINDARLYDVCDEVAADRDEEFTKGDPDLREGRRAR